MSEPLSLEQRAVPRGFRRDAEGNDGQSEPTSADKQRLSQMLTAYFPSVWRLARRMGLSSAQAEEVAQEAFVVASTKLAQIDPALERSYLHGVTLRLTANLRRSAAARHETVAYEPTLHDAAQTYPGADELLELKQRQMVLDQVLEAMSSAFREVLVLFEIEQCSLAEIAEALGIPEGTVASRLRRAREDFARRVQRLQARQRRIEEAP